MCRRVSTVQVLLSTSNPRFDNLDTIRALPWIETVAAADLEHESRLGLPGSSSFALALVFTFGIFMVGACSGGGGAWGFDWGGWMSCVCCCRWPRGKEMVG
jgi:hypothetical protein